MAKKTHPNNQSLRIKTRLLSARMPGKRSTIPTPIIEAHISASNPPGTYAQGIGMSPDERDQIETRLMAIENFLRLSEAYILGDQNQ